jgi:hypothetical protein
MHACKEKTNPVSAQQMGSSPVSPSLIWEHFCPDSYSSIYSLGLLSIKHNCYTVLESVKVCVSEPYI